MITLAKIRSIVKPLLAVVVAAFALQATPQNNGTSSASAPPVSAINPTGQTPQGTYQPKSANDPAKSDDEFQALAYMRVVVRAQRQFKAKRGRYATSLLELAGHGSLTKRMARSTDRGNYTIGFHEKKDSFVVTATPKQFDPTHRAFYADDDGKIRVEDDKPAGPDSPVLK